MGSRWKLKQAYVVEVDKRGPYAHHFGGDHDLPGATCPNCRNRLTLYMMLDLGDPCLSLAHMHLDRLPLLYCMRCEVCCEPFAYQVLGANSVRVVEATVGARSLESDWQQLTGGAPLAKRWVTLRPAPNRLNRLNVILNNKHELGDAQTAEHASITGEYTIPEAGGYPIAAPVNQIGGIPYLQQGRHEPICPVCVPPDRQEDRKKFWLSVLYGVREDVRDLARCRMSFLAAFMNQERTGLRILYDDVQIDFYICARCRTIAVTHSLS